MKAWSEEDRREALVTFLAVALIGLSVVYQRQEAAHARPEPAAPALPPP